MSMKECYDCYAVDSFVVDYREGTVVCQSCGCVQESHLISENSELRTLSKETSSLGEDSSNRIGGRANSLLSDQGLSTYVSGTSNDIAFWTKKIGTSGSDKTLLKGFRNIQDYCHTLNLNEKVEEEAKKIFREISEKRGLKGRQHLAVIAACIFIAARNTNQSRSIKELICVTSLMRGDLHRSISLIQKHTPSRGNLTPAAEYAQQLSVQMNLSHKLQKVARCLAQRSNEKGYVTGKNPMSVAGAAVYMTCVLAGMPKTFSEVSRASAKKDVTIKNCYKIMCKYQKELLVGLENFCYK